MGVDAGDGDTELPVSTGGLYITGEPESGALFRLPEREERGHRYRPGDHVTEAILLIEKLDEGAMGEIWRAHHREVDKDVAIKLISRRSWQHRNVRQRMKREAELAARVNHPHVVTVLDHGWTDEETPFLVMELLAGRTLEDELALRGRLPLQEVATLMAQLSSALTVIHDLDITHRDIKPANVFLSSREGEGEVFAKLVDFGIAKAGDTTGLTATGVLLGTPLYMNPERIFGVRGVDQVSDLWALSVVAYECLTGQVPFSAKKLPDFVFLMQEVELVEPTALCPDLPACLDDFFARALAQSHEDRFRDAASWSLAFSEAIGIRAFAARDEVDGPIITTEVSELSRSERYLVDEVLALAVTHGAGVLPRTDAGEAQAGGDRQLDELADTDRPHGRPGMSPSRSGEVQRSRGASAIEACGPRTAAARGLAQAVTAAVEVGDLVAARAAAKALLHFLEELEPPAGTSGT